MMKKINIIILFLIIEILTIASVNAAFCSLRDPISAIQMLYEEGYEFRSLVTTITEQDRISVKQDLPFTIHQSEVGKHTLYILYKNNVHEGFLQARSEWAKWGLVEIAWAINVDRSIKGFQYQRCRSPQCNESVVQYINNVIQNKNASQLKVFLSENGETLSAEGKEQFKQATALTLLTLRSALKTLAITDISWKKDIEQLLVTE
ncbi:MAG: hypothetical protein QNK36_17915 [Colwellia sp.]|nr:hypothetical protein [Colwellia sp.]